MVTGGVRINGKFFSETLNRGMSRFTHRYFIDGKLVAKATFFAEKAAAKAAEAAKASKE